MNVDPVTQVLKSFSILLIKTAYVIISLDLTFPNYFLQKTAYFTIK